ncbi:hypothetical protein [Microbacterium sp. NPDC055665]
MTVTVATMSWTGWWSGVNHPPPAQWKYAFEDFTGEETADEWGLAAAIFIAQYRRRHSHGPTFRELFEHLLPDTGGFPSLLPAEWDALDRRRGGNGFRRHVAIEWRRRGYIRYEPQVTRSLRVGQRFREQSRALNARVCGSSTPLAAATFTPVLVQDEDSLTPDGTQSFLRITPASLRRLSRHGYLHVIGSGRELRYPSWQFAGWPRFKVLPGVDIIVPAIPREWPAAAINIFMSTPHPSLVAEGRARSPVDWLITGSDPLEVVNILETLDVPSE